MTEGSKLFPELVSPELLLTWIFDVLLSCVSTNIGRFTFPFFSWAISGRKNKANKWFHIQLLLCRFLKLLRVCTTCSLYVIN